ncbi:MAG: flagellin, partial [Lachnospiraceae bacterium]|nr:flagellin [Lachnospiraceae bacterium]
ISMSMRCFSNVGKMDITSQNNTFVINVNGNQQTIKLDVGASYSSVKDLADALQKKLDAQYGSGDSGVKVTASGNNISLTTNLKGQNAKISCDTTSSFVKAAYTDIRYSSMQILDGMRETISVNAGDTFVFTYQGTKQTLTFNETKNYDRAGFKAKMNELLAAKNLDVRADEGSGSTLTLRSTTSGSGHKLEYTSADGGTITTKLFLKANTANAAATAVVKLAIQDNIQLEAGKSSFKIRVGSVDKTVQLPDGKSYASRSAFLKDLQDALANQNIGVTAILNKDNQLEFTTIATGSSAYISVSYDANSALKAIYGTKPVKQVGLQADFNGSKLRLTAVDEDGKTVQSMVSVSSATGSIFQTAVQTGTQTASGTSSEGYHSQIYSAVEGAALRDPAVKIDQWNKDLVFRYNYLVTRTDGTTYSASRNINITLDEKIYTYDELKKALEEKLNPTGTSKDAMLQVEVSEKGVKIIAGNPGRGYYMEQSTFSGGFYYNVLRRTAEQAVKTNCKVEKGSNSNGTYAVGRMDIRHNTTEITKGVNDTLTLDFTYGSNPTITFSMTLEPGRYSGTNLVNHIQKKLNEQLVAAGLEPNLIQAQIGGRSTNVYGSNDNDALTFTLANNIKLPTDDKDAEYTIDGIGGNAAFSVFYQTDGDIRIAYVTGTKDVSSGVTIPKESDLSFDVDGEHYEITMPAGSYSQEKMLEELNGQLKAANVPVIARVTNGSLTLSHTKYGKHQITNISGDAKKWLFFEENGVKEGEKDIWIRVGSESGDGVVIERPAMNTSFLGINSVTITKPKYAEKALTRVKSAVTKVSSVRSYFGSMQNRLEHTINQNNNAAENTQAAESAIRDADMAKEVLEMSKASILENVSGSLMTQANRARQNVLSLLQ